MRAAIALLPPGPAPADARGSRAAAAAAPVAYGNDGANGGRPPGAAMAIPPLATAAPRDGGDPTATERAGPAEVRRPPARFGRFSPGSGPELDDAGPDPSSQAGPGPPSLLRPSRSGRPAGPSRPRGPPLPVGDPVRLVPRSHLSPATLPGAEEGLAAAAARVGARRGAGSILRPRRGRTGAAYPGGGRGNIPPGRAPRGGPGCMGRGRPGAARGSGRRLPALSPRPERRLRRAPERGGGGRREGEGRGGGRAGGGQGKAGRPRRVPAAAIRPPPDCRRAEASPGRGGPPSAPGPPLPRQPRRH